jgi:hypothetical protein
MPGYVKAFAGSGVSLMDRVQGNAGTNITQASISTISYSVYRYATRDDAEAAQDGTEVVAATSLTVSAVVYDTLQTSSPWSSTQDSTGYNFRYNSVAADRPAVDGGGTYWHRFDVLFTPPSGAPFVLVWIVETLPTQ